MSHARERKEKICLNCKAELIGRYCHRCGQENIEPRSSVWELITHFFYDITHFDGKFFSTTGYLVTRPGFLPKEYMQGRRASYLNPIRMYIFTSAFFFLIFFSVYSVDRSFTFNSTSSKKESAATNNTGARLEEEIPIELSPRDSADLEKIKKNGFSIARSEYRSIQEYDSIQKTLPKSERDNWFERKVEYRTIELNRRVAQDQGLFWKDLMNKFTHTFPYLLFVSLPLYALYLRWLYIRHKRFYYVDHGMFLIYLYIFTFIFLLFYFAVMELRQSLGWGWLGMLEALMLCWGVYYAWRAMHRFYEQGRWKTLLKFFLFNLMCFISISILFLLFFILTVFTV